MKARQIVKVMPAGIVLLLGGLLAGCGSSRNLPPPPPPIKKVVQYAVTSGGENLSALTKVTDGDDVCTMPFGGDNGKDLFYLKRSHDGIYTYSNVYKKENPLASASSEKTSGKNSNAHPAYCKAIDKIVFRYYPTGSSSSDIYMMPASQGKALTQVTDSRGDWEDNPSFSPDGKTIAYIKYSGVDANIFTMSTDGDNQVQVTDAKKGFAQDPKWSPDGRYLIFSATKDNKNADIFVIRTDGELLTQLTTNESTDAQPYWTSDGYIYFTSDRGGKQGTFKFGDSSINV